MKAILVIDIPDGIFIDDCKIEYRVIENVFNMCVADGIKRLKPMPEIIDPLKVDGDNLLELGYMHGRNDLIYQLEGEEDE